MRRRAALIGAGMAVAAAEAVVVARRRGSLWQLRTIVRCGRGHLFTTIWIPGVSVKSVRLGWWRIQRCPVGRHFALVTPVKVAELTEAQRVGAARHRDRPIP